MLNILKKYPLGPFLITIFCSLHGITNFYQWFSFSELVKLIFILLTGITILFLLFYFITKTAINSGLFISILVLIFFYFGFLQDGAKHLWMGFGKLSYFIPSLLFILVLILICIKRFSESRSYKLNEFINILFLTYVIVDASILGYHVISKKEAKLKFNAEQYSEQKINQIKKLKPDIYFFVFDEYASSKSLKENFGFDNSALDSFFISNEFFIARNSQSNYGATPFSISSTLNMNYFENLQDSHYPQDFPAACESMYTNKLFEMLKKNGYKIYNYSIFDFAGFPSHTKNLATDLRLKIIFNKSILHASEVLYDMLVQDYYFERLSNTINDVKQISNDTAAQQKFIYMHLLLPHSPFIFNADGSHRSQKEYSITADSWSLKSYLNQLIYTNSIIQNLLKEILKNKSDKIIIVEGDHGYRMGSKENKKKFDEYMKQREFFKNLNAYYFYDKNYSNLYDSITTVNSFRIISNQYLNTNFKLLKDTSIHVQNFVPEPDDY